MYLNVQADTSRHGVTTYTVSARVPKSRRTKNGWPPKKDRAVVIAQARRIEKIARKVLGHHFLSLEKVPDAGWLFLNVKVGTSKKKRFELWSLIGWIALCAMK